MNVNANSCEASHNEFSFVALNEFACVTEKMFQRKFGRCWRRLAITLAGAATLLPRGKEPGRMPFRFPSFSFSLPKTNFLLPQVVWNKNSLRRYFRGSTRLSGNHSISYEIFHNVPDKIPSTHYSNYITNYFSCFDNNYSKG